MFDRLKRIIVESFIGAIALGMLLEQVILSFVNIFTSPVARWLVRSGYPPPAPATAASTGFVLQAAVLPYLIEFVVLMPVWYLLLRWLYFTPLTKDVHESPNPQ